MAIAAEAARDSGLDVEDTSRFGEAKADGLDSWLFLLALSLVATAVDYRFGYGNQTEQLPLILHALDPRALANDFYVEAGSGFGPRFYYVKLVVALTHIAPLTTVMACLCWLSNLSIAWVTHAAARDLLGASRRAGWIAATLALCVSSFALGLVTDIRFRDFQPGSLAIPFALAALWKGIAGRPVAAGLLAGIASIAHPLYGAETGALALAASGVRSLHGHRREDTGGLVRGLLPTAIGGAILGIALVVFWALPGGGDGAKLSADEVVDILASFRAPHHYLPSTFPLRHYVAFALFCFASGWALERWLRRSGDTPTALAFVVPPVAITLACLCGYVFVELVPTTVWATAQPFRMLYAFKWLGYLVLATVLAQWLDPRARSKQGLAITGLLGTGGAQPLLAAWVAGVDLAHRLTARIGHAIPEWISIASTTVVAIAVVALFSEPEEFFVLSIGLAMIGLLSDHREVGMEPGRRAAAIALAAAVLVFIGWNHGARAVDWPAVLPATSFADHRGDDADVARWAAAHTAADARFIVPPDLGSFRILAERAVVVDYKSVPFGATAMREWYRRMIDVYGGTKTGGWSGLDEMEARYARIPVDALEALGDLYGASYAVLFAGTAPAERVVYSNGSFEVIGL